LFGRCTVAVTLEQLREPVVAADGLTYERDALQGWLDKHADDAEVLSPATGLPLAHRTLTPDTAILEKMRSVGPSGGSRELAVREPKTDRRIRGLRTREGNAVLDTVWTKGQPRLSTMVRGAVLCSRVCGWWCVSLQNLSKRCAQVSKSVRLIGGCNRLHLHGTVGIA